MSANGTDPARPVWLPAQFTITNARSSFRILLEGQASNGGFAVDDVKILPRGCKTLPKHAEVRSEDCSFERGICGWQNMTRTDPNERPVSWQVAADMHRPAQLPDKTFGTTAGDTTLLNIYKSEPTKNMESSPGEMKESCCIIAYNDLSIGGQMDRGHEDLKVVDASASINSSRYQNCYQVLCLYMTPG
ncbi:hypothetical protein C0J52_10796 [Blattella germanica]|nr:hypothetical protein C0J52_10796 [Blattella germanica]